MYSMGRKSKSHPRRTLSQLLIAICYFLVGMEIVGGVQAAEQSVATRERHRQELERLGGKLLQVIRHGDIEGLIALVGDDVELGPDYKVTKRQLAQELGRREGRTYASLFDTQRLRVFHEEFLQRLSPEQRKDIPVPKSVQDHLQGALDVEIKVRFLVGETTDPPALAVVGYDWPGRPSLNELPNPAFMWTPRGWKLIDLFTVQAWAIAAPGYRP